VPERGGSAESFPDTPRRVVRFIGNRQVLWSAEERARESKRYQPGPVRRRHDELTADRRHDPPSVHRHPPRHHAEEAGDGSVFVLIDQRRQGPVDGGSVEKDPREVGAIGVRRRARRCLEDVAMQGGDGLNVRCGEWTDG
jgi:hypothetical protein